MGRPVFLCPVAISFRPMESLQLTLAGIVAVVWVLSVAARRYPGVAWLQPFSGAFKVHLRRKKAAPRDLQAFVTAGPLPAQPESPFVGPAVSRVHEAHAERSRRRHQIYTGIEFILMGIVIPPGYLLFEMMMFFSETTATEWFFVVAASLLCIGLGTYAIVTAPKAG